MSEDREINITLSSWLLPVGNASVLQDHSVSVGHLNGYLEGIFTKIFGEPAFRHPVLRDSRRRVAGGYYSLRK